MAGKKKDFVPYKNYDPSSKKMIKKAPLKVKIICAVTFIIGVAGTFLTTTMLQKNDVYELTGERNISLFVNDTYEEPEISKAIQCVSFGRNAISSVSINKEETTFNAESLNNEGTYYIVYQSSDFKYKGINRIRTITVTLKAAGDDEVGA